ncbi:MAG TPA: VOC family protein [Acetobacteraceae bacterium]|nr:VOC family protein [Acetobacteraceae bacterium]
MSGLVAELRCADLGRSLRFYTDVLGFDRRVAAPEHGFAELGWAGAILRLTTEAAGGAAGEAGLEYPFGRGVTLIFPTDDAEALCAGAAAYGARLHRPLETRTPLAAGAPARSLAFELMDPDGYVLRFVQDLGRS